VSRRRKVTFEHVVLDVLCHRGHRVGATLKLLAPHPRAGQYATAGGVKFEDRPDSDSDSGRLRGRCRECGDDVQIAWSRARADLDARQTAGQHTGEISP
jgi:hypothetical protein